VRRVFVVLTLTASVALLAISEASAAPIVVPVSGPMTQVSANLGTAGTAADPWSLNETFTAPGVGILQFSDPDGQPLAGAIAGFTSGSWFTKTVLNTTDSAWTSFELELREVLGTPSGEGDGLSFAQGAGLQFTSTVFSTLTRIDLARDYLNFSGGTVAPGGSVTFRFAVTDNTPQNPFYLAQTANKLDAPSGPQRSAAVPEPGVLTLLATGLIGFLNRRRR
jgi:hypothetical protein